jgi:hypothetical protein
LEFKDSADKGREARFMVLTIEPSPMPSSKRSFQGEVEEANTWASLKTDSPDNLAVGSTRLNTSINKLIEPKGKDPFLIFEEYFFENISVHRKSYDVHFKDVSNEDL